ncbi:MAG: PTS system mannose/fructose/sorbose family transporter subunit IID [Candidatus Deferrimicrobiaceae bacterium]
MSGIPQHVRRKVWFRQFLLQACWNYEGMQNVGFAYSILPALRHRYEGRPEEFSRALKRHLEFFNTHPAMAAVILGSTIRLEERVAEGTVDPRAVGTFKVGMMGSLGAIGDSYFWGALKPMASVAGAILAFVHPLLGIAMLLFLYNSSHMTLRFRGFAAGMEGEESAVRFLKEAGFTGKTEDRKMIAAILSGAYGGVVASQTAHLFGGAWLELGVFLVAALAVHLFTVFFRKAVSPSEVLVLLFLVGTLILWQ